jgi:hypothetical protein
MGSMKDDMLSGAGQLNLDTIVEGNLLLNAAGAFEYEEREKKRLIEGNERVVLQRVLKHIPIAMAHLRKSLKEDDDYLAVYRLVESAYIVGALTQITDAMPKIAAIAPGSEGGKKSAEVRAAKDMQGWHVAGLRLALECVASDPSASLDTIATHMETNLKGDDAREFSACRSAVRRWRASGKLPPRQA